MLRVFWVIALMSVPAVAQEKPFWDTTGTTVMTLTLANEGAIATIGADGAVRFDWEAMERRVEKCAPLCREEFDFVAQLLLAARSGNWTPLR